MLNFSVRSNNFPEYSHIDVVLLELKMLYCLTRIYFSLNVQIRYKLCIKQAEKKDWFSRCMGIFVF